MKDHWVEKYRPKKIEEYGFKANAQKGQVDTWKADKSVPHLLFSAAPVDDQKKR